MVPLKEYARNFEPHAVPDALSKLVAFDAGKDRFYSSGFELSVGVKESMFGTYSKDPAFLGALYHIGQATSSGSDYAIWHLSGSLDDSPILIFGDEGGIHVVARNISGLLRLLSFDAEPLVDWDSVSYYKDDEDDPSEEAASYANWLENTLGLHAIRSREEVDVLLADAQQAHAAAFRTWLRQYCAE